MPSDLDAAIAKARASCTALRRHLLSGWTRPEVETAEAIRSALHKTGARSLRSTQLDHPANLEAARRVLGGGSVEAEVQRWRDLRAKHQP